MVYTPIYNFSAPVGKYLEPATSSHPIKEEGYEIRPDFISLARELIFARSLEKKPIQTSAIFSRNLCQPHDLKNES
jgi:hypothetical protein